MAGGPAIRPTDQANKHENTRTDQAAGMSRYSPQRDEPDGETIRTI